MLTREGAALFGAIVCQVRCRCWDRVFELVQVPLLDMKRYHKLLAGASWMAEVSHPHPIINPLISLGIMLLMLCSPQFGDPDKPEEWDFLQHHSPYQRLNRVCLAEGSSWKCPTVLFVTSTKDDRVHPGHARKMARALLDLPSSAVASDHEVMYWENIEGGHGGAADNKQRAYMWALAYNFLRKTIGGGFLLDKYSNSSL